MLSMSVGLPSKRLTVSDKIVPSRSIEMVDVPRALVQPSRVPYFSLYLSYVARLAFHVKDLEILCLRQQLAVVRRQMRGLPFSWVQPTSQS